MMILVFASTAQRLQQLAFAILQPPPAKARKKLGSCLGLAVPPCHAIVAMSNAIQNALACSTMSTTHLQMVIQLLGQVAVASTTLAVIPL
jgi:hypothetical protein